jgi:hypothetical protein
MFGLALLCLMAGLMLGPSGSTFGLVSMNWAAIGLLAGWTGRIIRDLERRLETVQRPT